MTFLIRQIYNSKKLSMLGSMKEVEKDEAIDVMVNLSYTVS